MGQKAATIHLTTRLSSSWLKGKRSIYTLYPNIVQLDPRAKLKLDHLKRFKEVPPARGLNLFAHLFTPL